MNLNRDLIKAKAGNSAAGRYMVLWYLLDILISISMTDC